MLVIAEGASRPLFSTYGPSPIVYVINGVVAAAFTWLFYYRLQLTVDTFGLKLLAFVCWAASGSFCPRLFRSTSPENQMDRTQLVPRPELSPVRGCRSSLAQ